MMFEPKISPNLRYGWFNNFEYSAKMVLPKLSGGNKHGIWYMQSTRAYRFFFRKKKLSKGPLAPKTVIGGDYCVSFFRLVYPLFLTT